MSKRTVLIALIAILALGAVLRLWNLSGPDMVGDPTTYSFRSVGYYDWIASLNTQTTPVVWFDAPQWWQKLSFHDAPPLVFAVQWFFFQIFGDTIWAARIPFVLAGLFAIFGIFLLGRGLAGERVGLVAAGALAIMNYSVWISRAGFLDGFVVLWIIYSLYFFLKAERNPRSYLAWGICCGLGLMSKYTFLFMGPVYVAALLIFCRSAWRERWFYLGIAGLFLIISPVIIYNVMVWRTRGHLDAALSTLIGQHPDDYYILAREVRTSAAGIRTALHEVRSQVSLGTQFLLLASFVVAGYTAVRERLRSRTTLVWIGIAFALLMLVAVGGDIRFSVVLLPFLALVLGFGGAFAWDWWGSRFRYVFLWLIAVVVGWESAFAAQSQVMPEPIFDHRLLSASRKATFWHGYNALDAYLTNFYREYPEQNQYVLAGEPQIRAYKEQVIARRLARQPDALQATNALVYDDRMDWFAIVWLIERRRLYEGAFIPSLTNFIQAVDEGYLEKFREFGFRDITFVISTDKVTRETIENRSRIEQFVADLESRETPAEEIRNARGEVIFQIYKLPLDVGYFGSFAR